MFNVHIDCEELLGFSRRLLSLSKEQDDKIAKSMEESASIIEHNAKFDYLSGRSLNVVTGTLRNSVTKSSVMISTHPQGTLYEIDVGILNKGVGANNMINPKSGVRASVYGGAWEGKYPLPRALQKAGIAPRPWLTPATVDAEPTIFRILRYAGTIEILGL